LKVQRSGLYYGYSLTPAELDTPLGPYVHWHPRNYPHTSSTEIQVTRRERQVDAGTAPPANMKLLTIAAVLLAAPVVALLWVDSYASVEPTLAGFPFFIWYQFLWVFLCAACTWGAYRLTLVARPHRPLSPRSDKGVEARR
jgi:hypothetical protein